LFHAWTLKYTGAGPANTGSAYLPLFAAFILLIEIFGGNGSPVAAGNKSEKTDALRDPAKKGKSKGKTSSDRNPVVGEALRSIYQRTIDESVPQEMLDLLGKLG